MSLACRCLVRSMASRSFPARTTASFTSPQNNFPFLQSKNSFTIERTYASRRTRVRPPLPQLVDDLPLPPLDGDHPSQPHLREIANDILALNYKELQQLMEYMMKDSELTAEDLEKMYQAHGGGVVMAAAPMQAAAGEAVVEEEKPEQTEFKVKILSIDDFDKNKLKMIKAIRTLKPGEPLDQSKSYVTNLPSIFLEGVSKEEGLKVQEELAKFGGKVELE